jgi:hypothetical protein
MALLLATSSRVKGTYVPLTRGEPIPSLTVDGTEWRLPPGSKVTDLA